MVYALVVLLDGGGEGGMCLGWRGEGFGRKGFVSVHIGCCDSAKQVSRDGVVLH